jgi:hypothetical protein
MNLFIIELCIKSRNSFLNQHLANLVERSRILAFSCNAAVELPSSIAVGLILLVRKVVTFKNNVPHLPPLFILQYSAQHSRLSWCLFMKWVRESGEVSTLPSTRADVPYYNCVSSCHCIACSMSSNGVVEQIYKVTHPTPSTHRRSPNPPYKMPSSSRTSGRKSPGSQISRSKSGNTSGYTPKFNDSKQRSGGKVK